jgi:hypothetical protein
MPVQGGKGVQEPEGTCSSTSGSIMGPMASATAAQAETGQRRGGGIHCVRGGAIWMGAMGAIRMGRGGGRTRTSEIEGRRSGGRMVRQLLVGVIGVWEWWVVSS